MRSRDRRTGVRTARTVVRAAAALGLGTGLAACSGTVGQADKAVDETYEVTGSGADGIRFHDGGGKAMEPKTETAVRPSRRWPAELPVHSS
ncbi:MULTISPECIES: hypothetical protein [unclassified Streptomyces]|uniref:hypothetical protein n=1 Tax=unclassified Streptomyces TaxID=2593676 RepID=UPI003800C998